MLIKKFEGRPNCGATLDCYTLFATDSGYS